MGDFFLHLTVSAAIYFYFEKMSWLVMLQIGKEGFDYLDYGGFDVTDWCGDFVAIVLILIIKKL